MLVYKFYSAKWGLQALEKERIKISRITELNDPFDFFSVAPETKKQRLMFERIIESSAKSFGIISTSKSWYNPLLWSHYADSHKGICIELKVDDSEGDHVEYKDERKKVDMDVNSLSADFDFKSLFENQKTKFTSWEYEDEYRIFVEEPLLVNKGIHFKSFSKRFKLKRVILGARYKSTNSVLNKKFALENIPIITSRLSFHDYKIVEQKNRRMNIQL